MKWWPEDFLLCGCDQGMSLRWIYSEPVSELRLPVKKQCWRSKARRLDTEKARPRDSHH